MPTTLVLLQLYIYFYVTKNLDTFILHIAIITDKNTFTLHTSSGYTHAHAHAYIANAIATASVVRLNIYE